MAKKALVGINTTIMDGKVLDVVAIGATFEVHTDLTWVDCPDTVQLNWKYDGSSFIDKSAKTEAEKLAVSWKVLRSNRDKYLRECDWMSFSDSPTMTDAWKTYRQALRDLPANTSDPNNPTWPTKPS
tara:strand:+ start:926 stop:1306 length:381 start_codon:yes stop_codon:yes gene_type:complete